MSFFLEVTMNVRPRCPYLCTRGYHLSAIRSARQKPVRASRDVQGTNFVVRGIPKFEHWLPETSITGSPQSFEAISWPAYIWRSSSRFSINFHSRCFRHFALCGPNRPCFSFFYPWQIVHVFIFFRFSPRYVWPVGIFCWSHTVSDPSEYYEWATVVQISPDEIDLRDEVSFPFIFFIHLPGWADPVWDDCQ